MPVMSGFRGGLANAIVNSRYSPTAFARADYLTAVAAGLDAYWVADHLNALFPRSIYTPEYVGVAKVVPKVDACLEPWTLLGHLASRARFGETDTNPSANFVRQLRQTGARVSAGGPGDLGPHGERPGSPSRLSKH